MSKRSEIDSNFERGDREFDLLDLIGTVWKYRLLVVIVTLSVAVASFTYALISIRLPPERSPLPNQYEPQALILVNGTGSGSALQSALNSSGLSNLAGLAGASTGGYGELAVKLLEGNTILDSVSAQFDLAARYRIEDHVKDNARRAAKQHSSFHFDSVTNTISISYKDIDPVFATNVVNYMVTLLAMRFATIGGNRNIRQRNLLEEKLVEVDIEILRLEGALQDFQRTHGTLTPEILAAERVAILGEMRARLINREIEIESYSEFASANDPFLLGLRSERNQLQRVIGEMEEKYYGGSSNSDNKDIPGLAVEYGRLERDIQVQGRIYEVLTQQYELAKLSLEREDPIFQVLELADVPGLKSGPARSTMVILATLTAFVLSIFLSFVLNAWSGIKNDPERMRRIRGA